MKQTIMTTSIAIMTLTNCTPARKNSTVVEDATLPAQTMLVGTYTTGSSLGIYSYRFDQEQGTAHVLHETTVENPSYVTANADGTRVYAVSELPDHRAAVYAYAFDKAEGAFQLLNHQPTGGEDPCHIIVVNGSHVVAANYSGGSLTVFPLAADGSLLPVTEMHHFEGRGVDPVRQEKPHLHHVCQTPDGQFLLANDLGTDRIHTFRLVADSTKLLHRGEPTATRLRPGDGPRHLAFAPNGKHVYVLNELSGTVVAFAYEAGILKEIQTLLADTVGARGSADIHVSPDGKFLYASNRLQADGIAIFGIDTENGKLTRLGYQLTGIHPRNFVLTPNGKYLLVACRDSHIIQVFRRDSHTGLLSDTGQDIRIDSPVCIRFVP